VFLVFTAKDVPSGQDAPAPEYSLLAQAEIFLQLVLAADARVKRGIQAIAVRAGWSALNSPQSVQPIARRISFRYFC
jgi:hypothetical protein